MSERDGGQGVAAIWRSKGSRSPMLGYRTKTDPTIRTEREGVPSPLEHYSFEEGTKVIIFQSSEYKAAR